MASPRRDVVKEGVRAVYHCTARCVRRAFLCGADRYSGKNYEHRRTWFRDRLRTLSQIFTIDILAYAAMQNHHHEILRTRPDLAAVLSDEEVVRRWMRVFPRRRTGTPEDIENSIEREVAATLRDTERVKALRSRLSSVSWFMKSLNENIARRANAEDDIRGRFWEGRFTCQRLEDEAAILACMTYVDLNPVRAKLADSLIDSEFTSAYDRIQSVRAETQTCAHSAKEESTIEVALAGNTHSCRVVTRPARSWLASLDGSDRPFAHISERMYLKIVDETGRKLRDDKRGSIAPDILPVLEALDIDAERWVSNIKHYGSLFHRIAGTLRQIQSLAAEAGKRWFAGKHGAKALYRQPQCNTA